MQVLVILLLELNPVLGQELLVKLDDLPYSEINTLHEKEIEVWEWNSEFSLVVCDEGNIPDEYKTIILDENPRTKNYFVVWPMEPTDFSQYSEYIDVLWVDEKAAIVTDKGKRPTGVKIRAEIRKIKNKPIIINQNIPEPPPIDIRQNPLIEELISYIDSATVFNYTKRLQDFVTRNNYTDSIVAAAAYVFNEFTVAGLDLVYYSESGTDPWGSPFPADNIVGIKYGETDSALIMCGHLDATAGYPWGYEPVAPGADDNGSGSAGVMTSAKAMTGYDYHHELRFICFVGEELGLYGSEEYADSCANAGSKIIGVYNMDMIAHNDQGGTEDLDADDNYHPPSGFLTDTLISLGGIYVPALPIIERHLTGGSSDHASFQNAGYAAILTIDDAIIGANPYIHTEGDTIGPSANDFTLATNSVKAVVATVAELAGILGTGIAEENFINLKFMTLPTIITGPFDVLLQMDEPSQIDLSLYALTGEKVLSLFHGSVNKTLKLKLHLPADLPNGIYFFHLKNTDKTISEFRKIIVIQ